MTFRTHVTDVEELACELERAGIYGHGGAYFPTWVKLRAVATQGHRPVVVVNGAEGEPLSRKDRFVLRRWAGAMLGGALAVAEALCAKRIMVAIDHRDQAAARAVSAAVARLSDTRRNSPAVELVPVRAAYVIGQETALISYLQGACW